MGYIKWMDNLSKVLKIVFCIFYLDLTWMVYRIIKKVNDKNWAMMVVWILIAVFLGWIWWIVDLITVIVSDKVYKKIIIIKHLAGVVKRPNTPGCEPGIRQFESGHSPQTRM